MNKRIYLFEEGNKDMRDLLGGKGANLAEMTQLSLPVPSGFTITTGACNEYLANGNVLPDSLKKEIEDAVQKLEQKSGKELNNPEKPLLVSVRSGSVISMPGMMDTILNLGLNDKTVEGLAKLTNDARFAYDCYRRLLQMFADVVLGASKSSFDKPLDVLKEKGGYEKDTDLTADDLKNLCKTYQDIYIKELNRPFPQDPKEQLLLATEAVFSSWDNPRAKIYRNLNAIPNNLGTAVNVQLMVFGNSGEKSGTGVAFTRNPSTGENEIFGEFLLNAQGEDVVAGIRTPLPIASLEEYLPNTYHEFVNICARLEEHYHDMQDIEFTIENEKLYMLQTRSGKRTAKAAFKIATDFVDLGYITKEEAIMRIEPQMVDQILHAVFDPAVLATKKSIAKGLPASPGAVTGLACFDVSRAKALAAEGHDVVLIREETSPEDIEGMIASKAVVTSRGGMTSHAAVVARGMGLCCVAGCEALRIGNNFFDCGDIHVAEGEKISINGSTGEIYLGEIPTITAEQDTSFQKIMNWSKEHATLGVRVNAETTRDLETAMMFGADGVGLVRTEHMFFEKSRLIHMRKMILSDTTFDRMRPLEELLKIQTKDFYDLYSVIGEKPATIRLLDPPLHEFLPTETEEIKTVANEMNITVEALKHRITALHEVNPMLGHRGCRLAVSYPEIYEMQVEAMITSVIEHQKNGVSIVPEIMIPLIGSIAELKHVKESITAKIESVLSEANAKVEYKIGTMIEIPRACLTADKISEEADFFSFGTNDLTQMTYGFSRDDAAKFIGEYIEHALLPHDPFQSLDTEGVGELIKIAVKLGRSNKPSLKIGVCGEVGGDPKAIDFFQEVGLDYVSCSPFRIPIARLAAAQAALKR